MIVLRGHPFEWEVAGDTAVTVGVFDGVHLGHRQVIGDLVEGAHEGGLLPTVLTFDPHPLRVLAPEKAPPMLTDVEQRLEQFRLLGVEVSGVLHFPDIRDLSAEEFCTEVLAKSLRAKRVVIGADFRFGRDRSGDAAFLNEAGPRLGFETEVVDLFGHLDGVVSSTRIRSALLEGMVEAAAEMLSRPYELTGVVVPGDRRGQEIGYPTANLEVAPDRLVPGDGIYAAWAVIGEEELPAAVSIGNRPTYDGTDRRVEAHLLDWSGNIYGDQLALRFISRLRGEERFETTEDLVAQIEKDVAQVSQILASAKVDPVPHNTQV